MRNDGRDVEWTQVVEWQDGRRRRVDDELIVESPLEIRVNGAPISVTMRTPGADAELAAGFLLTEGVITRREQIASIETYSADRDARALDARALGDRAGGDRTVGNRTTGDRALDDREGAAHEGTGREGAGREAANREGASRESAPRDAEHREIGNRVDVQLSPDLPFDAERLRRHFYATSSCGVCGKASLDAVRIRGLLAPSRGFRVAGDLLCALPDRLRAEQALFGRTGALHAAATFDAAGTVITLREDVGRHNAVDKIVGHALLNGRLPLEQQVLLVSGRGGFELVQKALAAGVPVMACVSAPSSLAVALARELDLTLVGFLRGRRFIVYAGAHRIT